MKLLPARVVVDQLDTLRHATTHRVLAGDYGWLYVVPVLVGIAAGIWGVPHVETGNLLAAVAVLPGLIFNLSFSVFDKSLQIRRDPIQSADPIIVTLVEELRANVNYTVLVGIILTGVLASASLFSSNTFADVSTGLIAGLMAHMLLMCAMVLKRFGSLHDAMKP